MGDYRSNVDRPPAKKMCVSVANSEYSGYSEYADQESSDLSQVQNRGRYVPPYSAHMPSKQNSFTKRNRLAVNNRAAPLGSSFKPQDKNDSAKLYRKNNVDVISAKLNDLKIDNVKNPVAKLHEIMTVLKKTINYDLVSTTGHVHSPNFTFCAKSDDIIAYGSGSTKKDAKKNASIAFLSKMDFQNFNNDITSTTSNVSLSSACEDTKIDKIKPELNHIGLLQELCMANHWQLPDYEYCKEDLYGSYPWYKVICSVMQFKCTGEGKTKQAAKKQSALYLYGELVSHLSEKKDSVNITRSQKSMEFVLDNNDISSNLVKINKLSSSEAIKHVNTFFIQLKSSSNPSLTILKNLQCVEELSMSFIAFLDKVGEEEGFTVTYVNLNNPSKVEVMIQVTIFPLLVNIGSGSSVREAQENAAYSALVYIKLLFEK